MKLLPLLLVLVICFIFTSCSEKRHPLVKDIGLDLEYVDSESSINQSVIVFVYTKKGLDFDLYEYVCTKAKNFYKNGFNEGVELKKNNIPKPDIIDKKYTKNLKRGFEIRSSDLYSSVYVIEFEDYVVVLLSDARI